MMLYKNIYNKKQKGLYVMDPWPCGLKAVSFFLFVIYLLFFVFVFRVRLREPFMLFIVLAAYHEKITKQYKRASCKKNKKQDRDARIG